MAHLTAPSAASAPGSRTVVTTDTAVPTILPGTAPAAAPAPPAGPSTAALELRERQQALVARIGEMGLAGEDIGQLASAIVRGCGELYPGASCGIGELLGGRDYRMVAGSGWMEPLVGPTLQYDDAPQSLGTHTLSTFRSTVVADLRETRFRSNLLSSKGVLSSVTGPIPGPGGPWGTFGLFSPEPSRFVSEDGRFVEALIQTFASALARKSVEESLAARERQQATVARLGSRALSGLPLAELFDVTMAAVAETLGVRHVGLCRLSSDGPRGTVDFVAGTGWPDGVVGSKGLPMEKGGQGEYMLAHRRSVVYADVATESRFGLSRLVVAAGVRSGMTVLVPGRQAPWGILGAHDLRPRAFSDDDVNFLEAVAQILANAIQRQQAEDALAARVRQQATVARLGHVALHAGLPELLDSAARQVAATLDAEFCKVLELDAKGETLLLRAGAGWRDGTVGKATVPADSHSQAGFALGSDRAIIVDDLRTETRFEPAPLLVEHGVVSGMSVIIRGHDRPFGVLGVHSRQRRAFTPDDIQFLEGVAALLGSAVERLRVQEQLDRHRANLEEAVADRTRQLAASNRELEAFSSAVSHDLRAPLRTITGYSTLLASVHGGHLKPEARQLIVGVQQSAERLGRLIDDLLDLSRVQRVDLVRERVDLSALAQQALASLAGSDPGHRVAWTVEPGLACEGDPRLLGMLVDNLVGNAWKFSRKSAAPRIEVGRQALADGAGRRGPSGTAFFVRDNGAGFDMAHQAKLFQPFQRLHRASEFEGTGIGLATVRRIVERHGGQVWAEASPGRGATFSFTLG